MSNKPGRYIGLYEDLDVSSPLDVAFGGTGLTTAGTNYLLTGNGTGALTAESTLTYSPGLLQWGDADDSFNIIARYSNASGDGGASWFVGGAGAGTDADGGALKIIAGNSTGTGTTFIDFLLGRPAASTGSGINSYLANTHSRMIATNTTNDTYFYEGPNSTLVDYFKISVAEHGVTTLTTVDDDAEAASLTLDADGYITLDAHIRAAYQGINLATQGQTFVNFGFHHASSYFYLFENGGDSALDYFSIDCAANGATRIVTFDSASTGANLDFAIDGLTKFTSLGVEIENTSATGAPALLIDNDDVDQKALAIEAANTTANIIDIDATAMTTGKAIHIDANSWENSLGIIHIDCDDAQTTDLNRSGTGLINIDYLSAVNVASSNTVNAFGLNVGMRDTSTNVGGMYMAGIKLSVDYANTGGTTEGIGIDMTVTDADTNTGINLIVEDGGTDIICKSSADNADFFSIATTASGATTLTTYDSDATAANFEVAADGNITLDADGNIELETAGGVFNCDAASVNFTGTGSNRPSFNLTNNADDATGPNLTLSNLRDGNGLEDADVLGTIAFIGDDVAGGIEAYGSIVASVIEADNGNEAGQIAMTVANDGTERNGITMTASAATAEEIDVTIGNGAASVVTIPGRAQVSGGFAAIGGISGTAGAIRIYEDSDNGSNRIAISAPSSCSDREVTMPDKDGTIFVINEHVAPASGASVSVGMQVARRTITQAEMNALHTTPIVLIPAQGANTVIIPVSANYFVDRASNNTNAVQFIIGYDSPAYGLSIFFAKRFFYNIATDLHSEFQRYAYLWGTSMTAGVNTNVDMSADGAFTTNAFTSVDVYCTYYVIDRS